MRSGALSFPGLSHAEASNLLHPRVLCAHAAESMPEPTRLALARPEGGATGADRAAGVHSVDVPLAQTVPQLFANRQRFGGSAEIERCLKERTPG